MDAAKDSIKHLNTDFSEKKLGAICIMRLHKNSWVVVKQ